jgi:hypothetical protein
VLREVHGRTSELCDIAFSGWWVDDPTYRPIHHPASRGISVILSLDDLSFESRHRIADYLTAAGDYMAEHHKCNRVAGTPDGRVCALGAICRVTPPVKTTIRSTVITAFLAFLGVASLPDWNDESTESEVIQAFYDAATKFRPDAMISE